MMKLIRKFFAFIRTLAGYEDDVEKIMKPITDIVDRLGKHAEKQQAKAISSTEEAGRLLSEAEARRENAKNAKRAKELAKSLPAI